MTKVVCSLGGPEGVALRAVRRAGFALDRGAQLAGRPCPEAFCILVERFGAQSVQRADWDAEVMGPLRRCFDLISAIGREMRARDGGSLIAAIPACALRPVQADGQNNVLDRALLGLMEGLRAELQDTQVAVSILFHDGDAEDEAALAGRLAGLLQTGDFYSLSPSLGQDAIQAYFEPILLALSETSSGRPLPDIGPMAAVYLQKA